MTQMSALETASAIRTGQTSVIEVVEDALDRGRDRGLRLDDALDDVLHARQRRTGRLDVAADGVHDAAVVGQRLAHAHEHDVRQPLPELVA